MILKLYYIVVERIVSLLHVSSTELKLNNDYALGIFYNTRYLQLKGAENS